MQVYKWCFPGLLVSASLQYIGFLKYLLEKGLCKVMMTTPRTHAGRWPCRLSPFVKPHVLSFPIPLSFVCLPVFLLGCLWCFLLWHHLISLSRHQQHYTWGVFVIPRRELKNACYALHSPTLPASWLPVSSSVLQPREPPFCVSKPCTFPLPGLCTWCFFCLEDEYPRCWHGSLCHFHSAFYQISLARGAFAVPST